MNKVVCSQCNSNNYSFDSVLTIGYYIGRWYERSDAFLIKKNQNWIKFNIEETNPEFRFCKLINDAKGKNWYRGEQEKLNTIDILANALAWKLNRYDSDILSRINFLIHVPKFNEGSYFNHAYYYAQSLSNIINIPFHSDLVIENEYYWKKGLDRFSVSTNPQRIRNQTIMIVDDVYTSGRTVSKISKLLTDYGASNVYIGVIGRTKG